MTVTRRQVLVGMVGSVATLAFARKPRTRTGLGVQPLGTSPLGG